MIDLANKHGLLLLTLSVGGRLLIAPQDIESYSEFYEQSTKKQRQLKVVSEHGETVEQEPKKKKPLLVISLPTGNTFTVTETIEDVLAQIKNMGDVCE